MIIGFALWFYAGYKIGHSKATRQWIKKFTDLVKAPETEITADMDKITYKFNIPFLKVKNKTQ